LVRDYRENGLVQRRITCASAGREHGQVLPTRVGTPRKGIKRLAQLETAAEAGRLA
jgi:hypothetical protein